MKMLTTNHDGIPNNSFKQTWANTCVNEVHQHLGILPA